MEGAKPFLLFSFYGVNLQITDAFHNVKTHPSDVHAEFLGDSDKTKFLDFPTREPRAQPQCSETPVQH
jgi:hypothetical protein